MQNNSLSNSDLSQSQTMHFNNSSKYNNKVSNRLYTKSQVSNIQDVQPTMPGLIDIEYIVNADMELESDKNELEDYLRQQNEELMRYYQRGIEKTNNITSPLLNPRSITSPLSNPRSLYEKRGTEESKMNDFTSQNFAYLQYKAAGRKGTRSDQQEVSCVSDYTTKKNDLLNFALAKDSDLMMSQTFCENLQENAIKHLFDGFCYYYINDEFDRDFHSESESVQDDQENPHIAETVHQSSLPQYQSQFVSDVRKTSLTDTVHQSSLPQVQSQYVSDVIKISNDGIKNQKTIEDIGLSYTDISESGVAGMNSFLTNKNMSEIKTKLNPQSYLTNKYIDKLRISEKEELSSPMGESRNYSKNYNDELNTITETPGNIYQSMYNIDEEDFHNVDNLKIDESTKRIKWNKSAIEPEKTPGEMSQPDSVRELALGKRSPKSLKFLITCNPEEIEGIKKEANDNKKLKMTMPNLESASPGKNKSKSQKKKTLKFSGEVEEVQIPVILEQVESPTYPITKKVELNDINFYSDENYSPYTKSFNLENIKKRNLENAEKEEDNENHIENVRRESILVNADIESNKNLRETDHSKKSVKFDDLNQYDVKSNYTNTPSQTSRTKDAQDEHAPIETQRKLSIATIDKCFEPDAVEKKIVSSFADQPQVFLVDNDLEQEAKHMINKRHGSELHYADKNNEIVKTTSILKSYASDKFDSKYVVESLGNIETERLEFTDNAHRNNDDTAVSVRSRKSLKFVELEDDQLVTATNIKKMKQDANNINKEIAEIYVKAVNQRRDVNLVSLNDFEEGKKGEFLASQGVDDEPTLKDEKSLNNIKTSLQSSDSEEDKPTSVHKFIIPLHKSNSINYSSKNQNSKSILHNTKNYEKSASLINEKSRKSRVVEFTEDFEQDLGKTNVEFVEEVQIIEGKDDIAKNQQKEISMIKEESKLTYSSQKEEDNLNEKLDFGYSDQNTDNKTPRCVKSEENIGALERKPSIKSPLTKKISFNGQEGIVITEEDEKKKVGEKEKAKINLSHENMADITWCFIFLILIFTASHVQYGVIEHLVTTQGHLPLLGN